MKGQPGRAADLHTLTVKPEELPTGDKIPEKCDVLFERRFVWESIGEVEFCCRCYDAAMLQQTCQDNNEKAIVEAFKTKAIKALLTTLQQGQYTVVCFCTTLFREKKSMVIDLYYLGMAGMLMVVVIPYILCQQTMP